VRLDAVEAVRHVLAVLFEDAQGHPREREFGNLLLKFLADEFFESRGR
jgi:hypothetical protein